LRAVFFSRLRKRERAFRSQAKPAAESVPPAKRNKAVRGSKIKRAITAKKEAQTRISRGSRRSIFSSLSIFFIILEFVQPFNQAIEARDNAEDCENEKKPGLAAEELVEKITQKQAYGD